MIIFSPTSHFSFDLNNLVTKLLSRPVRMKSDTKENVPIEKERKEFTEEDRLAAPGMEDAERPKSSQNEPESWSEATGTMRCAEESVLGKRSFPGEMNDRENAGGGTPDRPGRPSVPTPSKGRVFYTIDNFRGLLGRRVLFRKKH